MRLNVIVVMLMAVLMAGCATGPSTVARAGSLKGDKVIFFEQSDRIPKEVLLKANENRTLRVGMAAVTITPEMIAKAIKEALKVAPEIAKVVAQEKMENSLIQRRILLRGYEGNELKEVIEIIKAFNSSIEFVTPHDEPKK